MQNSENQVNKYYDQKLTEEEPFWFQPVTDIRGIKRNLLISARTDICQDLSWPQPIACVQEKVASTDINLLTEYF